MAIRRSGDNSSDLSRPAPTSELNSEEYEMIFKIFLEDIRTTGEAAVALAEDYAGASQKAIELGYSTEKLDLIIIRHSAELKQHAENIALESRARAEARAEIDREKVARRQLNLSFKRGARFVDTAFDKINEFASSPLKLVDRVLAAPFKMLGGLTSMAWKGFKNMRERDKEQKAVRKAYQDREVHRRAEKARTSMGGKAYDSNVNAGPETAPGVRNRAASARPYRTRGRLGASRGSYSGPGSRYGRMLRQGGPSRRQTFSGGQVSSSSASGMAGLVGSAVGAGDNPEGKSGSPASPKNKALMRFLTLSNKFMTSPATTKVGRFYKDLVSQMVNPKGKKKQPDQYILDEKKFTFSFPEAGAIAAAVIAVVAGVTYLATLFKDEIKGLLQGIGDFLKTVVTPIGQTIARFVDGIATDILSVLNTVAGNINKVVNAVGEFITKLINTLSKPLDLIGEIFTDIKDLVHSVADFMKNPVGNAAKTIKEGWNTLFGGDSRTDQSKNSSQQTTVNNYNNNNTSVNYSEMSPFGFNPFSVAGGL